MAYSTFGSRFRGSTFGESHAKGVGAIVDGCPSKLELSEADIQTQLTRRRPGQSNVSTPRDEDDQVSILSGVENGKTLGSPIGLFVANKDQRPGDYGEMAERSHGRHMPISRTKKNMAFAHPVAVDVPVRVKRLVVLLRARLQKNC